MLSRIGSVKGHFDNIVILHPLIRKARWRDQHAAFDPMGDIAGRALV